MLLSDPTFPVSPTGKTGWPWAGEIPQIPAAMSDGSPWPRISIVTPSYNQGQFIEETIRSILLQGYPNLEYIIIDGGSTDGSVEIIKKYAPWLTYWVSEKDRGQSHAINKGFERSTGEIVAWLNSDDYYFANVFEHVAEDLDEKGWVLGNCHVVTVNGIFIKDFSPPDPVKSIFDKCIKSDNRFDFNIAQPGNFWSKKLWFDVGSLNEKYHYCMDLDWVLRALSGGYHPFFIKRNIACMRQQPNAKTISKHWEFGMEGAYISLDLALHRILYFWPTLKLARFFLSKSLKEKSDNFYMQNRLFASFAILFFSFLLADNLSGRGYRQRFKRFFQL